MRVLILVALVIAAGAETPTALVEQARTASQHADFQTAERLYREALKAEPRNLGLWNDLGVALNRLERYADAAEAFRAALRIDPAVEGIRLNLGIALFRGGKPAEAAEVFAKVPQIEQARQLLAMSYVALQQFERAIDVLEPLAAASRDPAIHMQLANCYARLGRKADVEKAVARMFAVVPDSAALHVALGQAYESQADRDRAIEEFRKAADLDPTLPGARLQAGRLLWKLYRFEEAIIELQAELKTDPSSADAKYFLGSAYLYANEPAKAVPLLDDFVKARPAEKYGYLELGQALLKTGDLKRAATVFEKAVALSPAEMRLHYKLAQVYTSTGRLQDAEREFAICSRLQQQQLERENTKLGEQRE